jgi:hypothetical protein
MRAGFLKASRRYAPGCLRQRFAGASHQPVAGRIVRLNLRLPLLGNPAGNRVIAVSVVLLVALVAVEAYGRGLKLCTQLVVRNASAIPKSSNVGSGVLT